MLVMTTDTHALFEGTRLVSRGSLPEIAATAWEIRDREGRDPVLIVIDRATGKSVPLSLDGPREVVVARAATLADGGSTSTPRGRGRPRLGVVGREVTLLPEHWRWLEQQSGNVSAVLRRLVHDAMRGNAPAIGPGGDALAATDRFITAFAGDLPGYEEATRWLYRRDRERFAELIADWPSDVRDFAHELAAPGWSA